MPRRHKKPLKPGADVLDLAKKHRVTLADPSLLPTLYRLQVAELRRREEELKTTQHEIGDLPT